MSGMILSVTFAMRLITLTFNATSFCDDCVQFMCNNCYKFHERFNATRGHNVKTGRAMPRSQADKPPKFSKCDEHPKHLKNSVLFLP